MARIGMAMRLFAVLGAVALVGGGVEAARVKVSTRKLLKGKKAQAQAQAEVHVQNHNLLKSGLSLASETEQQLQVGTLPPSFWMWKTTPAPPTPPGPYAQVIWVPVPAPPVPTIAPTVEQCYGCDCLFVFADKMVKGGAISNDFTCIGGKAKLSVPSLNWAGTPVNSGVGHAIKRNDNTDTCAHSMSMALVVEDMDYPNGVGEDNNRVQVQFWAANIPGDWKVFDQSGTEKVYKGQKVVHLGVNDFGSSGMEPICPTKGLHRYRFTLWSLRDYVSSGDDPLDPNTSFAEILPKLQKLELQRATFYGNVKADPAFFGAV